MYVWIIRVENALRVERSRALALRLQQECSDLLLTYIEELYVSRARGEVLTIWDAANCRVVLGIGIAPGDLYPATRHVPESLQKIGNLISVRIERRWYCFPGVKLRVVKIWSE